MHKHNTNKNTNTNTNANTYTEKQTHKPTHKPSKSLISTTITTDCLNTNTNLLHLGNCLGIAFTSELVQLGDRVASRKLQCKAVVCQC